MTNPLLELKMHNIVKGKLIDSSVNKKTAEVHNAILVEDDVFRTVLKFDGTSYVKLPLVSGIKALSLWVNLSDTSIDPWAYLLDPRPKKDSLWVATSEINRDWAKLRVDGKEADLNWGNIPNNKWVHLYLEAKEPFSSAIYVMARHSKEDFARGKLSRLRLYGESLNGEQLEAQRNEDLKVRNTYRAPLPIDFNLLNKKDEKKILYITDHLSPESLDLEIRNTSPKDIELRPMKEEDGFHFALEFRPGVLLSGTNQGDITTTQKDWKTSSKEEKDHRVIVKIRYVGKDPIKIPAGNLWKMQLKGFIADNVYGSRGTQVMLKFQNLFYARTSSNPLTGTQIAYLNIVSRMGKEYIPLHAGIIGSNTVLNDGQTTNELILRITNISKDYIIKPQNDGGEGNKDSKFTFSFASLSSHTPDNTSKLTTKDSSVHMSRVVYEMVEVELPFGIRIKVPRKKQTIPIVPEGDQDIIGVWAMDLDEEINPGQYIDIQITFICDTPSGIANLYINCEDIPGYWDAQLVVPIEKGPMVFRRVDEENRVGVGTDEPGSLLDVHGTVQLRGSKNGTGLTVDAKGNVGIGLAQESDFLMTLGTSSKGLRVDGPGIMASFGGNGVINVDAPGKPGGRFTILDNGNVGIGKTDPSEKLHVDGNIKAEGRINDKTGFVMPVGTVVAYAGTKAPEGWLLCNGTPRWADDYKELAEVLGADFRSEQNGKPVFAVPDLRKKFVVGAQGKADYKLGAMGGQASVKLTESQMPSHSHGIRDPGHTHTYDCTNAAHQNKDSGTTRKTFKWDKGFRTDSARTGIQVLTTGRSQEHENRPPFVALNYIIKY